MVVMWDLMNACTMLMGCVFIYMCFYGYIEVYIYQMTS